MVLTIIYAMSNIGGIVINHDKTRKTIRHIENSREVGVKLREKSGTVLVIHFESEIDHLVYQLYGLTEEEIKIVEGKE